MTLVFAARDVESLPTGLTLAGWGVAAFGIALVMAGWAWMSRLVNTERDGDDRGIFELQAVMASIFAVIAAIIGVAWILIGMTQAGTPTWIPAGVLAAISVTLIAVWWRHRRAARTRRSSQEVPTVPPDRR